MAAAGSQTCTSTTSIRCSETIPGTIEHPPDEHCYVFDAHAGDVLSITIARVSQTGGSFEPYWSLFAPDEKPVAKRGINKNSMYLNPLEKCNIIMSSKSRILSLVLVISVAFESPSLVIAGLWNKAGSANVSR
jgi:hypothetical protein